MTTLTNHGPTSMAPPSAEQTGEYVERVVRITGRRLVERNRRFQRKHPLCKRCTEKHQRVRHGTQVDHVIPLAKGGRDVESNLQNLCDDCHVEKTAEDFGKQVWPRITADGWPDPNSGVRKRW